MSARERTQRGRGQRSCHVSSEMAGTGQDLPHGPPKPSARQPAVGFWGCRIQRTASRSCPPRRLPRGEPQDRGHRERPVRMGPGWGGGRDTKRDMGFLSETLPLEHGGRFETFPRRERELARGFEGLVGRRGCGPHGKGSGPRWGVLCGEGSPGHLTGLRQVEVEDGGRAMSAGGRGNSKNKEGKTFLRNSP